MVTGKKALITGVTGQDGSILASFLLDKDYEVHGLRLYSATPDELRLGALEGQLVLHDGDLTDPGNITRLLAEIRPDEIYNLGAQSHVGVSFKVPAATAQINGLGALHLLEAMRNLGLDGYTRFYQASSSEMFGASPAPQNEDTPFRPCSPYGTAKLFAYWTVRNYRDSYGVHASNGILFNHESPVRGEGFVTRKITKAVAAIVAGRQDCLMLGNLNARRDWGHARDYAAGMWAMLQQDKPGDYVLATGRAHSVRDFVTAAFSCAGLTLEWRGQGLDEQGIDCATGQVLVKVDPAYFRPGEVNELIGDASRARAALGWRPQVSFEALVAEMVAADMDEAKAQGYGDIVLAAE